MNKKTPFASIYIGKEFLLNCMCISIVMVVNICMIESILIPCSTKRNLFVYDWMLFTSCKILPSLFGTNVGYLIRA
jgi:hypothetical protein